MIACDVKIQPEKKKDVCCEVFVNLKGVHELKS